MAKAKSIYLVALALGMLLAPAGAEARPKVATPQQRITEQYMRLVSTTTCADYNIIETRMSSPVLPGFVEWYLGSLIKVENQETIIEGVAIYCIDPAHAAVTLEQATSAIYDAATTPNLTPEDGKKLQDEVRQQGAYAIIASPTSTEAQKWVAYRVLLDKDPVY